LATARHSIGSTNAALRVGTRFWVTVERRAMLGITTFLRTFAVVSPTLEVLSRVTNFETAYGCWLVARIVTSRVGKKS
jgi:hypothetical protein